MRGELKEEHAETHMYQPKKKKKKILKATREK